MPTLTWTGKEKVINHHQEVPFRVLEHRYGFNASAGQTNQETGSGNKIIHGDNLLALKTLLPEYEGRIKCIYIDPPYNTGNEGWVYNDNVNDPKIKKWLGEVVGREGEDLNRHDKWLCMMYPRLKLLHKLLSPDGVIFVSIDDIEVSNLRLIMDDIFGKNKFIAQLIWKSRQNKDNRNVTGVSVDHEYVLCYGSKLRGSERKLDQYKNPDNDPRGLWTSGNMVGLATQDARPNLHYDLIDPVTGINYGRPKLGWRYDKNRMAKLIKENRVIWPSDPSGRPRVKNYLAELTQEFTGYSSFIGQDIYTRNGSAEISEIFGERIFDFPKPSSLIRELINQVTDQDSIILDSFAGSGTTAHAVLNLNKQDGGNRKFILVEMEDYAETITAERVRRVMKGYNSTEGTGGEFDYYELGRPLFRAEGELNEDIPVEKIRNYVFYTETKRPLIKETDSNNPYFLEKWKDTGYYFYYEKDRITTLDPDFLATIDVTAEQHLIYADKCLLDKDFLANKQIIFKKIPRDITRF
jgi:adenine-specific DNA-methyltransferase